MKRAYKIFFTCLFVLMYAQAKSQSSATAEVSATIVRPASISIDEDTYNQVITYNRQLGKNTNYELTVARISVAAQAGELFDISMPLTFDLQNALDGSCIAAVVDQQVVQIPSGIQDDTKQFTLASEIKLPGGRMPMQYNAEPIAVTINFN